MRCCAWSLVGLLIAAGSISAYTFMGAPGWAYAKGVPVFYVVVYLGYLALVAWYFGPRVWAFGAHFGHVTQASAIADRYQSPGLGALAALVISVALVAAIAAILGPGIEPGSWTYPTTHTDLAPTILGALNLKPPTEWTGAPLGLHDHSRALFAATAPKEADVQQSILLDKRRLLYRWDGDKVLFNVENDPFETTDLYRSEPDRVSELWKQLQDEVNRLVALFPDKTPPVDIGP